MKKILIIIFLFITSSSTYCQINLDWGLEIGGSTNDQATSVVTDSDDNVYVAGVFTGTVDFDPSVSTYNVTSPANYQPYVAKYDAEGNFIWVKNFGRLGSWGYVEVKLDEEGNIYVAGQYDYTSDFDPGQGVVNMTAIARSIYILKLDKFGDFVWVKGLESSGSSEFVELKLDNNNVYLAGFNSYNSIDLNPSAASDSLFSKGFISKYNSDGNFEWAVGSEGYFEPQGIDIYNGEIFLAGRVRDTLNIDTFQIISNSSEDILVMKLDTNGIVSSLYNIGQTNYNWANDIVAKDGFIYLQGKFQGTLDFDFTTSNFNLTSQSTSDVFLVKYNLNFEPIWGFSFQGNFGLNGTNDMKMEVDKYGNVYFCGYHKGNFDPDPSVNSNILSTNTSNTNGFLAKYNSNGEYVWAYSLGYNNYDERIYGFTVDSKLNHYIVGQYNYRLDYDLSDYEQIDYCNGVADGFLAKYNERGVTGRLYNDLNGNCLYELAEAGLSNRLVMVNPGNFITRTNKSGIWHIDSLPIGFYDVIVDTSGNWEHTCANPQTINVSSTDTMNFVSNIGLINNSPCPRPFVSIGANRLRRCFSNQKIYVTACNDINGTGNLLNSYVDVYLDTSLTLTSASKAYTDLGGNIYRFNTYTLAPGMCQRFSIDVTVSCNLELGESVCMEAILYPIDSCTLDTIPSIPKNDFVTCTLPWDKSSIKVDGWCENDSIFFEIENTGDTIEGDMMCYSPVRLFVDGQYISLDSIKLNGGQKDTLVYFGDGRTWRLEVDQHPLHPGNSNPNATVELCGSDSNWTPDLVNILPMDDRNVNNDVFCAVIRGSFDPNDKTGYPIGVTDSHFISPNGMLEYMIRFQNTGNDTAFQVVIRDTLDDDLNMFSFREGGSSHNYVLNFLGQRVVEWKFYNIMLPDSTTDLEGSNGFITFFINQNSNLLSGTEVLNRAGIYFDFNAPILTNFTQHHINDNIYEFIVEPEDSIPSNQLLNVENELVKIYPNPFNDNLIIDLLRKDSKRTEVLLIDLLGKVIFNKKFNNENKIVLNTSSLKAGTYFLKIYDDKNENRVKVIKYY